MAAAPETIAAPLTAPGAAAVSVVRISGPRTRDVLKSIVLKSAAAFAQPRALVLSRVVDPSSAPPQILDEALVAFFPAPNSYTGEDCAELNLHGSPYILVRLMEALAALGVRLARPGEFTERAFLNGRIDLSQAEAVADLVAAETEAQARAAREQLEGRLSQAISDFGEPLRELVAEIEAWIDFPDEGIEPLSAARWQEAIAAVKAAVDEAVSSFRRGRLYREGAQVVLVGVPNAGKSSLLNALVGENRVIVTPTPGTTRDSIEERISLDGLYVRLWDTAGLVDHDNAGRAVDEVEKLGIERSWQKAKDADLALFVFAADIEPAVQIELYRRAEAHCGMLLPVLNKADLPQAATPSGIAEKLSTLLGSRPLKISAATGSRLEELRRLIYQRLLYAEGEAPAQRRAAQTSLLVTNRRHVEALERASQALGQAGELTADQRAIVPELVALELRSALHALDEIIGTTSSEDILGLIFSKFCIGK